MIRALAAPVFPIRHTPTFAPEPASPSTEVGSEKGDKAMADAARVSPAAVTEELSPDDQREVERLRARDGEVRAHEQAHAASGGAHAGAPSFSYETGPDGKRYAVDGEVSIDTSEVQGNPRASLAKLEQVVRAALAPGQPSGQDRRVASSARAKVARLRAEMVQAEPEIENKGDAQAVRAVGAYAEVASPSTEQSTVKMLACQDCGGSHAR